MKKTCVSVFVLSLALLSPLHSSAEVFPAPYKFFALDHFSGDFTGREDTQADLSAILLRLGYRKNNFIGFDMRIGYGGNNDTVYLANAKGILGPSPGSYDVNIEMLMGGYLKVYPFHWYVEPYLLGGYTIGVAKYAKPYGNELEDQISGASYGVGVELEIWKGKFVLENVQYMKSGKWDLDGLTLSWIFGF